MAFARTSAVLVLVATLAVACAAPAPSDGVIDTSSQDLRKLHPSEIVGTIAYGPVTEAARSRPARP
jgi:hypothetical protein